MERRTFFGVLGALLFRPKVAEPSVLYGGVKSDYGPDYDYHAQYALVDGVSVMLPEPTVWIEYDDGTFARMGDDGTFD